MHAGPAVLSENVVIAVMGLSVVNISGAYAESTKDHRLQACYLRAGDGVPCATLKKEHRHHEGMDDAVLSPTAEGWVSQVSFNLGHRTVTSASSNPNFECERAVVLKHRSQMGILVDDLHAN